MAEQFPEIKKKLGFGCMRFQRVRGKIDTEAAERQLMAALRAGVNYFDTAYIYPDSEKTIGEIFARNHCREQLHIATKLPHYLIKKPEDMERYFQEQLQRLQTDYVDYYLMHMLRHKIWSAIRYMNYAPIEASSNFFKNLANSLAKIEE